MQAFTPNTIHSAWKAIGFLPYNPTTILKTFTHIKPSESQDIEELNTFPTLHTPKTLRTVREIKSLYNQINELTTVRLNSLLKTPT
jgi:acetate kinase